MNELIELEKRIKIINQSEFEDCLKIITYINHIAYLIHNINSKYANMLKISVLLHTLTFQIKGKYIPVKIAWILHYI